MWSVINTDGRSKVFHTDLVHSTLLLNELLHVTQNFLGKHLMINEYNRENQKLIGFFYSELLLHIPNLVIIGCLRYNCAGFSSEVTFYFLCFT